MGFKNNWKEDINGLNDYLEILMSAFDLHFSSAIIRTQLGFENQQKKEKKVESNNNNDTVENDKMDPESGESDKKEETCSPVEKFPFQSFPNVQVGLTWNQTHP